MRRIGQATKRVDAGRLPHPPQEWQRHVPSEQAGTDFAATLRDTNINESTYTKCGKPGPAPRAPTNVVLRNYWYKMKSMDFGRGQGANHSDTRRYRADLQRRHRPKDAI